MTAISEHDSAAANHTCVLNVKGSRGALHFLLQRVAGGVYVEREEVPRRGLRTMQSIQFASVADFIRWCDSDPVRFEHPLLHVSLKRDGEKLWNIEPKSPGP